MSSGGGTSLSVAWVGNSYTFFYDMPAMVTALAAAQQPPTHIEHRQWLHGGWTIGQHYRRQETSAGNKANDDVAGARELLDRPYDLVVLQDQSQTPGYLDSDTVSEAELQAALEAVEGDRPLPSGQLNRAESLLRLRDFYGPAIARAGARAVLYSSWGRQHGRGKHSRAAACALCGKPLTRRALLLRTAGPKAEAGGYYASFEDMLAKLTTGVREYARTIHSTAAANSFAAPHIAPAGAAFALVHADHDPVVAFERLYQADESHPSFEGSYLVACVFVAVITGRSPAGLPAPRSDTAEGAAVLACAEAWRGESLEMSAEEAGYLQRVAHEAVFGGDPPKL